MTNLIIYIVLILILLLLSAFFSGSETALFSLKTGDILRLRKSKKKKNLRIAKIMRAPQKILISILIGNLFVNMFLSALSTDLLINEMGEYGHFIAIGIITPLIIIFCEITPKVIAVNNYEQFSKNIITLLYIFHKLIFPFRLIFVSITNLIIKIFRINVSNETSITEDELNMAVTLSQSKGVIGEQEGGFIKNVLKFSKKEAENIMIPRNEVVSISSNITIDAAYEIFQNSSVVRAPVFEDDMDHIVGQIDARDLVPYILGYKKAKTITRLIQPIVHYPSSKELGELLSDFLKNKIQIAVVIDEYGGTAGIVTLSSIISELMGDEFALTDERKKPEIKKISIDSYVISGEMQISDFTDEFKEKIKSSEAETIGGFFIEKIGHFPKRGETIEIKRHTLKVRKIKNNRIETIEINLKKA